MGGFLLSRNTKNGLAKRFFAERFFSSFMTNALFELRLKESLRVVLDVALPLESLPEVMRAGCDGDESGGSQAPEERLGDSGEIES
jgi:hypothetical protein